MEQRARKATNGLGPNSPIPEKLYFKIGEVSALVGVRAHVLRYWEKEVPAIRPGKSASSQRRYRRKDVQVFREIRRLLHEERYTLAGARKRIMAGSKDDDASTVTEPTPLVVDAAMRTEPRVLVQDGLVGVDPGPQATTMPDDADRDDEGEGAMLDLPVGASSEPPRAQLRLGFQGQAPEERSKRLRDGLRELIYLAGEEP